MSQAADNDRFVTEVQRWLRSRGRFPGKVDGWAGPETVTAFRIATNTEMPSPSLPPAPLRQAGTGWPAKDEESLIRFFGAPGTNQVPLELPYTMRLAWDLDVTVNRTTCHALVRDSLRTVLEGILSHYGSLAEVRSARMDLLGGVYSFRKMRDRNAWSVHAFGAAIDLDTVQNGLNTAWPGKATMPEAVIAIFARHGWTSLARAIGRDAMHFQATTW